ncbi:hypothetical protein L208DRAFT_575126 [Tricholoma matsutake]|nr:hypothetical protein L208DRAFT_575126 [Tricholoma matsutake 945]
MGPYQALVISEIIREIVTYLKPEFYHTTDPNCSRDLLSAALCCKAFKDPALDVLWHTVDSITPLLKLIPGMQEVHGQVALRGDLDASDMKDFYSYARRVRHCTISVFPLIEPTTCVQLSRLEHGVFPFLTSLRLPNGLELLDHADQLPLFLPLILRSHSLSSVTCLFICCNDPDDGDPLGGSLLTLAQNVNIQALHHMELRGTLQREHISALSHFSHLHSLSLRWLGKSCYEVIDVLSRLQQLVELQLGFAADVPEQCMAQMSNNPFPAITKLWLRGDILPMIYILDGIAGNYLESVRIEENNCITTYRAAEKHRRIYQTFARFPSLRSIDYTLPGCLSWPAVNLASEPVIPASVVRPLLELRYLDSLSLEFLQPWFQVTDEEISDLAVACPSLKSLALHPKQVLGKVDVEWPTFTSLLRIATSCSNLTALTMSLDARSLPSHSELPSTVSKSHGLQRLNLAASHIDSPLLLARILRQLFPLLESVKPDSEKLPQPVPFPQGERWIGRYGAMRDY